MALNFVKGHGWNIPVILRRYCAERKKVPSIFSRRKIEPPRFHLIDNVPSLSLDHTGIVLVFVVIPWRTVCSEILPTLTRSQHCPARSSPRKSRERPSPSDQRRMSDDIRWDIRIEPTRASKRIRRNGRDIRARSAIYSASIFLYVCHAKRKESESESERRTRKISRNALNVFYFKRTKDIILTKGNHVICSCFPWPQGCIRAIPKLFCAIK